MKKLLPITIIVCMALASCGGGSGSNNSNSSTNEKVKKMPLTDLQQERLSGKVVSVRQRVYWAVEKFGRIDKGKLQNLPAYDYLKVYDNDGYLLEETHYDVSDKVVSYKKINYNAAHKITIEEMYKESILSERIDYTYDDNNRLVKKEKFDGEGKIKEWMQYTYGKNNLVQDEDWYKADGALNCKYIHVYDNAQRLTEKQKYWGGGSLAQKEYYYYEDAGSNLKEIASEKYKNKESSFDYRFVYNDYNSFGDYGQKEQYNEDGELIAVTLNVYNDLGHLIGYDIVTSKIMNAPTATPTEDDAETETDNSPITIAEHAGQAYEYGYDSSNNWTQKVTYKISGNDDSYKKDRQFYYERIIKYKE